MKKLTGHECAEGWYKILHEMAPGEHALFHFYLRADWFLVALEIDPDPQHRLLFWQWDNLWSENETPPSSMFMVVYVEMFAALNQIQNIFLILRQALKLGGKEDVVDACLKELGRGLTHRERMVIGNRLIDGISSSPQNMLANAYRLVALGAVVSEEFRGKFMERVLAEPFTLAEVQEAALILRIALTTDHLLQLFRSYRDPDHAFRRVDVAGALAERSEEHRPLLASTLKSARQAALEFHHDPDTAAHYAARSGEPLTEAELRALVDYRINDHHSAGAAEKLAHAQHRLAECLARQYGAVSSA